MDAFTISFCAVIALVILILAFVKRQAALACFSGIVFVVIASSLWTGISFTNVTFVANVTNSTTVTPYSYTYTVSDTFTHGMAILLGLFGALIIFIGVTALATSKKMPLGEFFDNSSDD